MHKKATFPGINCRICSVLILFFANWTALTVSSARIIGDNESYEIYFDQRTAAIQIQQFERFILVLRSQSFVEFTTSQKNFLNVRSKVTQNLRYCMKIIITEITNIITLFKVYLTLPNRHLQNTLLHFFRKRSQTSHTPPSSFTSKYWNIFSGHWSLRSNILVSDDDDDDDDDGSIFMKFFWRNCREMFLF